MIEWKIQHYRELSIYDLYALLKLRSAVYVVEMNCPHADLDGLDLSGDTYHITGTDTSSDVDKAPIDSTNREKNVVAYLRIHVNTNDNCILIRRVVVAESHRRHGLARELMEFAKTWAQGRGFQQIKLSARINLLKFYESLGFEATSEKYYLEVADCWLIDMVKCLKPSQ